MACAAFFATGARSSAAALVGSDDFDDNAKDSAKWGADSSLGARQGTFTEANGRLEFTTPTQIGESFKARPWILNFGSYEEDWEVQIDTTVTTTAGFGRAMGVGIQVQRRDAPSFRMGIEHESAQFAWDYYSYLIEDGSPGQGTDLLPGAASGALRISFDATAKVLNSFYDADGAANGYTWTLAASFGVAGSGGLTGNANWGMATTNEFQILVAASSLDRVVSSGVVYADNFRAVPEPSSLMAMSGAAWLLILHRRFRG